MMKSFCVLLCLLLHGLSHSLVAQEDGGVKVHLLSYAPADLPRDFQAFYRSGDEIRPFGASSRGLGVPVLYQGPGLFSLYRNKEDFAPPKEGQAAPKALASVQLPAGAEAALVMALPTPDGKGLGLRAYDISGDTLQRGDYLAFNFSDKVVSVRMGERQFALKPGERLFLKDAKWREEAFAMPMQIAIKIDGEVRRVYSRYRDHFPQTRNVLCFFNGPREARPITFACFNAYSPPAGE